MMQKVRVLVSAFFYCMGCFISLSAFPCGTFSLRYKFVLFITYT
uniref:Uncharacterized protein n=1 Tax=Anguilla anguilla TaxID=7936 RepID=A0A0E9TLW8_ANGAN